MRFAKANPIVSALVSVVAVFLAVGSQSPRLDAQEIQYYHEDGIGNVRLVTDSKGNVVERHDYLPYGEECTTDACAANPGLTGGQPRKFTAKERDQETGLDYFGARYYGSKVARFNSIDPSMTLRENTLDPQRWNRYAYGRNNPLRFVDPDGRDWLYRTVMGEQYVQQFGDRSSFSVLFSDLGGDVARAGPPFQDQMAVDITIAGLIAGVMPGPKPEAEPAPPRTVIGKLGDLERPGVLRPGEERLEFPDRGSARANWGQNAGRLRQVLRRGEPIRDATVDPKTGALQDNTGFLRAERNLMENQGWRYDPSTQLWNPPKAGND